MPNPNMKLVSFRVTNFRSVKDSGWIEADNVTALIGINESGKSNLLTPLWKLKPATKEGEINLLTDAPRREYNTYRGMKDKPDFITARFELTDKFAAEIAAKAGVAVESVKRVEIKKNFDGKYTVIFPQFNPVELCASKSTLSSALESAAVEIENLTTTSKSDEALKQDVLAKLTSARQAILDFPEHIEADGVSQLQAIVTPTPADGTPAKSSVAPRYAQVVDILAACAARLTRGGPDRIAAVVKLVTDAVPVFVYYSTYGNLDSEIYLPHVIENMKRTGLTGKAEAQARTLRVLFDFVKIKPEEILELGKDHNEAQQGKATEAQVQALNAKKKERSILLQSASTELTTKFRDWWKQGEYRFSFQADGNHFRIWVSDDKRPEEIELEGRSTGLQWFLSFYLVFLVESNAAHNGAIVLLDEPGHTLHPLAQKDLSVFFDNLAKANQLLYTTHSPFLIDADHLDRVRNVYVDEAGFTVASPDLRAGQAASQSKSVYAVHASLGLSVSDTLFQGCRPVIVEGASDQLYMSAIKTRLVGTGQFKSTRELLFVPASGTKAIKAISSILGGRDEDLPVVLCDGDEAGRTLSDSLKRNMYRDVPERILLASGFIGTPDAEVEDLIPRAIIVPILDRYLRGPVEQPFAPLDEAPLIPQVKAYAAKVGVALTEGWKVEVARLVKGRLASINATDKDVVAAQTAWLKLFSQFNPENAEGPHVETVLTPKAAALN